MLRAALGAKVTATTIPQVFVDGVHLGGCTETMQALKDGKLQQLLAKASVAYTDAGVEPFSFLPSWLQKR
jgi:cysteine synthase A